MLMKTFDFEINSLAMHALGSQLSTLQKEYKLLGYIYTRESISAFECLNKKLKYLKPTTSRTRRCPLIGENRHLNYCETVPLVFTLPTIENIEKRPMPSSAWVGWRGVENVYRMEPVGLVMKQLKLLHCYLRKKFNLFWHPRINVSNLSKLFLNLNVYYLYAS